KKFLEKRYYLDLLEKSANQEKKEKKVKFLFNYIKNSKLALRVFYL
ncbi:MAG: hypothetical protein ACI848_001710, partial [Roseivirga sp.]